MSCDTRGYPSRAIARHTGLTRKTRAQVSRAGVAAPRYGPRAPRPQRLDPYRAYLRERVETYPRMRATRLLREIRELGYPGGYSQLTAYLREIRPPLEQFLAGLRIAWREGEARPTAIPVAKPKRGRRRPDPLVKVTEQLHAWFEAEPWYTRPPIARATSGGATREYPDGLLRTVQRRVKVWRKEKATAMLFGELGEMPTEESIVEGTFW